MINFDYNRRSFNLLLFPSLEENILLNQELDKGTKIENSNALKHKNKQKQLMDPDEN